MSTIAVNGVNSNSGGGRSILVSFVKLLNLSSLSDRYVVLTVDAAPFDWVDNPNIEIIEVPAIFGRTVAAPLVYELLLGRKLDDLGVDLVLNLGDLIIRTRAKQLYIFDWPYGVDVHPKVWAGMTRMEWINRKVKYRLIERRFKDPDIVVAQTDVIRQRLIEKYGLRDVRVVGNAVSLDTPAGDPSLDLGLPDGVKFVCPAVYYPHKNIEILLGVGELIRDRGLDYKIITTVDGSAGGAGSKFTSDIEARGLSEVIANVGQVPLAKMPALYAQCDALLMPTLLESFSIVYVESMHHDLPIFTSDMWFAHSVCGDAARYFDPFDPADILDGMTTVFSDDGEKRGLIERGHARLASFPDWSENFERFQAMIAELLS